MINIILADSNQNHAQSICDYFESKVNAQIDHVLSEKALWNTLPTTPYTIVLLSDNLSKENNDPPQLMGTILTQQIRESYPDIEIIVYTDEPTTQPVAILQAGGLHLWNSPFNAESIYLLTVHILSLYQEVKIYQELKILQEATAKLSASQKAEEILDTAMGAALDLTHTDSAVILFWDKEKEDFHPTYEKLANNQPMRAYKTNAKQQGDYIRQIIQAGESVMVFDTSKNPHINDFIHQKGRVSLIGVPIKRDGKGIAALFVHSHRQQRFSDHQQSLLETLAAYTSTALERAKKHEELQKAKGVIGTRTALAWMGLASGAWRHSIVGDAVTIKNAVQFLRSFLQFQNTPSAIAHDLFDTLSDIEELAQNILDAPITPLLSSQKEAVQKISINHFLVERIQQLQKSDKYADTSFQLQINTDESISVLASSEWLRYALDMVIDNSIDAMKTSSKKMITILTKTQQEIVCIDIIDTGKGIPKEQQQILFEIQPGDPKREGHLGHGLAMAQTIMHVYHGDIILKESNKTGTTMRLILPII